MASILITYGIGLAALAWGAQQLAPTFGRVTFIAGLAGGGLCLLWGGAAIAGLKGRFWATLSVIATAFVLLSQAIHVWAVSASESDGTLPVRLLVTLMLVLTLGMVMFLLHGERAPEFYERGNPQRNASTAGQPEGRPRHAQSLR